MAKKKKKFQESTIENYYDLKVDKVDELVAALKDEEFDDEVDYSMNASMGVDDPKNRTRFGKERQFDPYKTDFLGKVPTWLKALFVKFWFAGAVCYFIVWGTGVPGADGILLTGIVLGLVAEVLVNPLYRFMESDKREYDNYMMFPFPFKAYWTFFTNIIYYILVVASVNGCYFLLNYTINTATGVADAIPVGVEPLLFGVFTMIVDMAYIGIKDGVVALVRHIGSKKKEKALNNV